MTPDPIAEPAQTCEFCMASPVKSFDAAPILMRFAGELVLLARTKWPACAPCSALIDRDAWPELEDRATNAAIKSLRDDGIPMGYRHQQFVRHELRRLHEPAELIPAIKLLMADVSWRVCYAAPTIRELRRHVYGRGQIGGSA
jgi:hypothetical protein